MKWTLVVILAFLVGPLAADPSFWLRNSDPEATFLWWPVAPQGVWSVEAVLPRLPSVVGGPRMVAPGERVQVSVASGQALVGAFVVWDPALRFLTPVVGGVVLPSEFPARGTLLVDRPSFAAANRGRGLAAPLQAWGLVPPSLALGRTEGWNAVPEVIAWGSSFVSGRPLPKTLPRPVTLQVALKDGALWVAITADRRWPASGPGLSLVLRRPGAFLEFPLTGDPSVWLWRDGRSASAVGRTIRLGTVVQGWVPWDRLDEAERQGWTRARWSVELLATTGDKVESYQLGSLSLGELP